MNLRDAAEALEGEVVGKQVMAPGPGHSHRDRSLAVFLKPSAPDGFIVYSHAGDSWTLCREYVLSKLSFMHTEEGRGGYRPFSHHSISMARRNTQGSLMAESSRILAIWNAAHSLIGTPGSSYLAGRGIDLGRLPVHLDNVLRWHPSCPWGNGRHGCLLALMTDALSGEPTAIHRTALTSAGKKVGKKMLGPSRGSVVRLWPDDAVLTGLVLGEGIETTLAAASRIEHRGTHLFPAWAAGSAGGLAKFPVLPGIEALTLLVDNDESGAGQRSALECSLRWTSAGRQVIRLVPNAPGIDFNDLVVGGAA